MNKVLTDEQNKSLADIIKLLGLNHPMDRHDAPFVVSLTLTPSASYCKETGALKGQEMDISELRITP
jgi:hypothetical protein